MWRFFSHVGWYPYFFLIFDGSILTLCSFNITFDNSFVIYSSSFIYFFLKFDGSIVILSRTNIASILFLLHVTILLSHVSYVTIFLSYLVVPLLFSHIWRFHPHIVQFQYHMWEFFSHIRWFTYFFFSHLTVLSSHCAVSTSHVTVFFSHLVVLLLFSHIWWFHCLINSTNIASDSIFVTFSGTLFFYSQIWPFHYYIGQYSHYFWSYFCHIRWYPIFFLTIDNSIVTISTTNITSDHNFTFRLITEVTFLLTNICSWQ